MGLPPFCLQMLSPITVGASLWASHLSACTRMDETGPILLSTYSGLGPAVKVGLPVHCTHTSREGSCTACSPSTKHSMLSVNCTLRSHSVEDASYCHVALPRIFDGMDCTPSLLSLEHVSPVSLWAETPWTGTEGGGKDR